MRTSGETPRAAIAGTASCIAASATRCKPTYVLPLGIEHLKTLRRFYRSPSYRPNFHAVKQTHCQLLRYLSLSHATSIAGVVGPTSQSTMTQSTPDRARALEILAPGSICHNPMEGPFPSRKTCLSLLALSILV